MRCVTVKFVPRLLMAEQKDCRVSICTDLRDRAQNYPNCMSSVIIGDECWVYGYDLDTKQCPPSGAHHHLLDQRKRGR